MKEIAKGKRSIIYLSIVKGKKIAKKVERKDIFKQGHVKNEAKWLKILNKYLYPTLLIS